MSFLGEPRAESFSHDADVDVRGVGPTLALAFEQAALALTVEPKGATLTALKVKRQNDGALGRTMYHRRLTGWPR
jgi:hypothetical protein